MAPSKDSEGLEESSGSDSTAAANNAGSSDETKEQYEKSGSCLSLRAVLELSEEDPLFKREKIKRPFKTYNAIMRSYTSTEIYQDSEQSNAGQDRLTFRYWMALLLDRRTYSDLFKRYQNFAVKFRNSRLVYIFQILLLLLPFSACWMGAKYSGSCPGSPDMATFTAITGIFGTLLVGQWIVIKCCGPEDRPCEGQQKSFILIFFVLVVILLELEIYHFTKQSLSFKPTAVNYCSKAFYDYTYWKFIASFVSMFLVVFLYFPDYRSYASDISCSDSVMGSCYKASLEEDD